VTPRQVIRLAAALGLLLLVWVAVALGRRSGRDSEQRFTLPAVDTARVDSVVITWATDTAALARVRPGEWKVNGHPTAAGAVKDLLVALADTAAAGDLVAQSTASHGALGVDSAGGRRLRVVAGGKTVADLVIGNGGQVYGTGYVRRTGEAPVYLVRTQLVPLARRSPDEWRDRVIAKFPSDSITRIEVERGRGRERYALRRKGATWVFASGAPADSSAAAVLLREVSEVDAAGFASPAQADSARFAPPRRRLRLSGPGGKTLLSLVFDSTAGGVWVRRDSGGTVYRLDLWETERLTPAESTLKVRTPAKAGRPAAPRPGKSTASGS